MFCEVAWTILSVKQGKCNVQYRTKAVMTINLKNITWIVMESKRYSSAPTLARSL